MAVNAAEARLDDRKPNTPNYSPEIEYRVQGEAPNDGAAIMEWLTASEAARHLKVQPRTILKWAKQGRIPAHPLSGSKRVTWRFLKSELDAMLCLLPSAAEHRRVQCAAE